LPTSSSTTKHFYDRGWSGVNIEPGPTYAQLLQERPRDVNLNVAAADHDGEIDFFEHPEDPGTSTTRVELHPNLQTRLTERRNRTVPCRTLKTLLSEHAAEQPIDFMSVDVEGGETAVIRGNDWTRFRPTIVLLEAVEPYSNTPSHQGWEPLMLQAGYLFAYFDGLNRFYVAQERRAVLEHFRVPVNVLDGFTLPR
jgi:FkbM family methyltransferase